MNNTFMRIFSLTCLALILSSCSMLPTKPMRTTSVSSGFFSSKEYTIKAEDISFILKGGKPFTPPFQSDMYGCGSECRDNYLNKNDLLDPRNLLKFGGKKVLVTKGKDKLYGVLVLNKVLITSDYVPNTLWKVSTPSLRSYDLIIPDNRFDSALNGRIEVVYEIFAKLPAKGSLTRKNRVLLSWILLMSKTPL